MWIVELYNDIAKSQLVDEHTFRTMREISIVLNRKVHECYNSFYNRKGDGILAFVDIYKV